MDHMVFKDNLFGDWVFMEKISLIIFVVLFITQFFFPLLAGKAKLRLAMHGYQMISDPRSSFFNITGFWAEAARANSRYRDRYVSGCLFIQRMWWVLLIIGILVFICK